MKGVELPINILVIVAIAVIVLLGLVAVYFVGFNPFSSVAGIEGIKNDACRVLVQGKNCAELTSNIVFDGAMLRQFDANKNNAMVATAVSSWGTACPDALWTGDNLAALCACYYSRSTEAQCKALCSCPGY